jgi:hypothetical protein
MYDVVPQTHQRTGSRESIARTMSSTDLGARDVNHDYLKNVLLKFIAARNTEVSDPNP